MKYRMKSKVMIDGIGTVTHEHTQDFGNTSNVFGRVLEYHRYMQRMFPDCKFELVSAKEVKA